MSLDALDPKYRIILCDVWGVIHDGVSLYPGAEARLARWKDEGRTVILLTNAPRTEQAVATQLQRIGLSSGCYDHIATSGEAGIAALRELPDAPGFLGTRADRSNLEGRGLRFADHGFGHIACTGLDERRTKVQDYAADLARWAAEGVIFHCLNPDKVVIRGGVAEPCAGAIAQAYQDLGGATAIYGKPNAAIYAHALNLAGEPPKESVLAVGDALETDVLGAARQGIDVVFVQGGIHADQPFPDDFASRYGLGNWRPVAIVDGLA